MRVKGKRTARVSTSIYFNGNLNRIKLVESAEGNGSHRESSGVTESARESPRVTKSAREHTKVNENVRE